MILVENLTKSFRDLRRGLVHAVDGVSFEVKPGEVFGLLGPNGAGKTTTLRILCTVLRPTSGRAVVAGHDVATQPDLVRQNIGFLSANTAIYDRMSAWELVEYFGRLYGLGGERLRERLETVFTDLQMNDFRDVLGAKMSTGMRQKASIARAIVHDPPVLIFDEPTAGLDVLVARAVLDSIERLRDGQVHPLLDAHPARGRAAVRPRGRRQPGPHGGLRRPVGTARTLRPTGPGRVVLRVSVLEIAGRIGSAMKTGRTIRDRPPRFAVGNTTARPRGRCRR